MEFFLIFAGGLIGILILATLGGGGPRGGTPACG